MHVLFVYVHKFSMNSHIAISQLQTSENTELCDNYISIIIFEKLRVKRRQSSVIRNHNSGQIKMV